MGHGHQSRLEDETGLFFACLTAANLVGKTIHWNRKRHKDCSPEVQQQVLAIKMASQRIGGINFDRLPNHLVEHILSFIDDGWESPDTSRRLLALNFPIIACLANGMNGAMSEGACWHFSRDQSALDGLAYAIRCLASDTEWQRKFLVEGTLLLLFTLLDSARFNTDVRKEAAAAALSLLELTTPCNAKVISDSLNDATYIHHRSVLLEQLASLPAQCPTRRQLSRIIDLLPKE